MKPATDGTGDERVFDRRRGRVRDGCVAADGRRSPCVRSTGFGGAPRTLLARLPVGEPRPPVRPLVRVMGASENEEYNARLRTRSERAGIQPPSRPVNALARTLRYTRYKFGGGNRGTNRTRPSAAYVFKLYSYGAASRAVGSVGIGFAVAVLFYCPRVVCLRCLRACVCGVWRRFGSATTFISLSAPSRERVRACIKYVFFFFKWFYFVKVFLTIPPPPPGYHIFVDCAIFRFSTDFLQLSIFFIYLRVVTFEVLKNFFFLEQFIIFIMK